MKYIAILIIILFVWLFGQEIWKARLNRTDLRNLILALVFFGAVGWAIWYVITHPGW